MGSLSTTRLAVAVVVAIALLASFAGEIWVLTRGQDRLDQGFGERGIVATEIVDRTYGPVGESGPVVAAPDGSIIAGGAIGFDLAVIRLLRDGRRDPTFGRSGLVRTPVDGLGRVWGLALQPDGMILAAGTVTPLAQGAPERMVLVRYRTDGDVDARFGDAGVVDIAGWTGRAAVAVGGDGSIVVAGTGLARFTAEGRHDAGFGIGGLVEVRGSDLRAIAIDPDQRVIVAGSIVARYTPDGRMDPTFGSTEVDGSTAVGTLNALAQGPDGRIIVAGNGLARLTADGKPDAAFASGRAAAGLGTVHAVLIQADGRILAGGSDAAKGDRFALARFGADGAPDPSFGSGGVVTTDVGGPTGGIRALALQSDGRIVAAGSRLSQGCGFFGCGGPGVATLLLARYDGR